MLRSVSASLLCTALTLLLSATPCLADDAPPGGTWKMLSPAPTKRTEVAAADVAGKIYVIGGFQAPTLSNLKDLAISQTVEEYDPASDRWSTKTPLPVGLHHAGIGVVKDKLYVIGGFTKSFLSVWHPVDTVYEYDPGADTWTPRRSMPTARGALAVTDMGGTLLAIGGYDGENNSAAVEAYDPANDVWTARAPLPTPRDHLAAATIGGRVYAIGGRLDRDYARNLAVTEVYDPAADRWSRAADLPTPRSGITAGVVDGTVYVLGGESPQGTFANNEAYDAAHDRWHAMAPMPTSRHGLGSAVVNGRLYVVDGGPKPGGSFSNANEMFEPPRGLPQKSTRTTPQQIGAVMALLATFEDAGTLPPESSREANLLIRALIQFQAAFMKSPHPAVKQLLTDALTEKLGAAAPATVDRFRSQGWTSQSLEAVVDYAGTRSVWNDPGVEEGFRAYNVGRSDFDVLSRTFRDARTQLAARGQDLHAVYASRRRDMPGADL